jgi:hypothetical protein
MKKLEADVYCKYNMSDPTQIMEKAHELFKADVEQYLFPH